MNGDKLQENVKRIIYSEESKGKRITEMCSYVLHNFIAIEDINNNPDRWIKAIKESK